MGTAHATMGSVRPWWRAYHGWMREFVSFLKSSGRFLFRTVRRGISAAVLLLLHTTNLYSEKIRANVPDNWRDSIDSAMIIVDGATVPLAMLILIGAGCYTFFEVDRELRDPAITKKLKGFYIDLENVLFKKPSTDEELEALQKSVNDKISEIGVWVLGNMEKASFARFTQNAPSGFAQFRFKRRNVFNDKHGELVDRVLDFQKRLTTLIEKSAWV